MNKEKLDKQLRILESVAEKLVNGCLTSGNIAHDGKTKGYTIQNVVNNIRRMVSEDEENKRIKYLAGCIYGDASSLTSGNISHHRIPIMKKAEEIINLIDKKDETRR